MTKRIFAGAVLLVALMAANGFAQTRWLSRYWDGCKGSCSWNDNVPANIRSSIGLCKVCDINNNVLPDPNSVQSSCTGTAGTRAWTCWDQAPFVDPSNPNLGYGFGATQGMQCGSCFEVTFDGGFEHGTPYATHQALRGKRVIIMGRNTGSDVGANQIDFMVPGGGLGQFDSFTRQICHNNSASRCNGMTSNGAFPEWLGARYGGFLGNCEEQLRWGNGTLAQYQNCIRERCNDVFAGDRFRLLRNGCNFYADFMMGANNPTGTVRSVTCPQVLIDRWSSNTIVEPPDNPVNPPVTTHTINVSRNNNSGGNVTVRVGTGTAVQNPAQMTQNAGTSITITALPATGFNFTGWTAVSGSLPSGLVANNAANTITLNSNVDIRANFTAATVQHALTVTRSATGGNVVRTVGTTNTTNPSGATNYNAGTSITLVATSVSGFTFQRWTVVSGTAPAFTAGSLTTATITFPLNAALSIRADFQQEQGVTPPTTFTVQAARAPVDGGTVTINGSPPPASGAVTLNQGATVTIAATAAQGHAFVNWTARGGTALPTTGFNADNRSNTFTLNGNVNVQANFAAQGVDPPGGGLPVCQQEGWPHLRLTVTMTPANAASVTASPSKACYDPNESVTLTVTPNAGFRLVQWEQQAGWTGTENPVTIQMWNNREVSYTFEAVQGGGDPDPNCETHPELPECQPDCAANPNLPGCGGIVGPPSTRTDTIKVEAEDFVSRVADGPEDCGTGSNAGLCRATNPALDNGAGITNIGWIANGNSATYEVAVPHSGQYTFVFRIASNFDGGDSRISIWANDALAGSVQGNTGDWDAYTYVTLANDVELTAGTNIIRLDFQAPVNVDYFLLLGDPEEQTSVRPGVAGRPVAARAGVTLASIPRGFAASLPANHGFTSYSVVDLRGRVVRSGVLNESARDVRVARLRSGVFFLRLEGANVTTQTHRAVTF